MEWVLDTSVTLTWCFEDERTDATEALLDRLATSPAVVPQNWPLEVANILTLAVRRGRLSVARREEFIASLNGLPIHIDPSTGARAMNEVMSLADTHRLTAYDAAYLELVLRLGVPLATLDEDLRTAARAAGVQLL